MSSFNVFQVVATFRKCSIKVRLFTHFSWPKLKVLNVVKWAKIRGKSKMERKGALRIRPRLLGEIQAKLGDLLDKIIDFFLTMTTISKSVFPDNSGFWLKFLTSIY